MRNATIATGVSAWLGMVGAAAAHDASGAAWRDIATATDEVRVDEWQSALVSGVLYARAEGFGDLYRKDRPLYSPTLDEPQRSIPAGTYSCSSIQIDKEVTRGLAYIQYPAFRCRVTMAGDQRRFEKLSGSQRTKGVIHDAPDMAGDVFLGTWSVNDDNDYPAYGKVAKRNEAGVVHSLSDGRWRLIFPGALTNGRVEILELKRVAE